jgi:hypothetical protein
LPDYVLEHAHCLMPMEGNVLTIAVDADFSFRGEIAMFKIFIFVALLT